MATIGVIGAGLAGLSVAYRCASAGHQVVLLEASSRIGGQLHTETSQGFVVEHGAEGFVAQSEALHSLAADLGLGDQIIAQQIRDSSAFDGSQLIRLLPGEAGQRLGFQVNPRAFGKGIESMQSGMMQLVDALVMPLRQQARILIDQKVQSVSATDNGLRIATANSSIDVDKLAIAVPSLPASHILAALVGEEALALAAAECSSSVTVSMVFATSDIACGDDTSGFIVGGAAQEAGFRACSYSSVKLANRSPDTRKLVRVFMRPTAQQLSTFSDLQWADHARQLLASAVKLSSPPEAQWVYRWDHALPVFNEGHVARVTALEAKLSRWGIVLAGAAFHGAGIDGAVRSANRATEQLLHA